MKKDSYQFHHHQQNEKSSLTITELTEHKETTTCDVRNPDPGLVQAKKTYFF
jgi:hypothetical protein